jgi:hypothetical protein
MRKVKVLTNHDPHFVRQASKYSHLLDLRTDIRKGERFIRYEPRNQTWRVYTQQELPALRGVFFNVIDAVFKALQ